jgi:hypothetical protein
MTEPPADALVVDNSILSAVATCDTYAYVRYGLDLVPRGTDLRLEAGSAIHAGLAVWMRGGMTHAVIGDAMAAAGKAYAPAVAAWEQRQEKPLGAGDRFQPHWVYGILKQWLHKYSDKFPFKLVSGIVEQPVAAPLATLPDGRPLWIAARLDARVRKFATGGRWNLDHKTTRRVTDWWTETQKTRSQFVGQLWIGEALGEELEGVILNVLEIPEPHKSEQTCREHKVSFQQCSIRHAGSDFVYISPHRGEFAAWEETATALARRYRRLRERAERDGIEGVGDVKMQGRFTGNCTFCELRQWCKDGRPRRPAQVRATFERRVWDPLRPAGE